MGFLILRFRCNCAFRLLWSQSSWQELYQPRRAERAACQPAVINHPSERRRFVSAEHTHSSIQTASGCEDAAGVLNQPPPDRPRASASTQECRGACFCLRQHLLPTFTASNHLAETDFNLLMPEKLLKIAADLLWPREKQGPNQNSSMLVTFWLSCQISCSLAL